MVTAFEQGQARRLKKVQERQGFCWGEESPVTDDKRRDSRIFVVISYYIKKMTNKNYNTTSFRALQADMYDTVRAAVAQDAESPAWATPAVVQGGMNSILKHARNNIPWAQEMRVGDFRAFFHSSLLNRDTWWLYNYDQDDPMMASEQMSRRGVVAISIDNFLDVCDQKDNEFAAHYPRLTGTTREGGVQSLTRHFDNLKVDNDDSYADNLFNEDEFEDDNGPKVDEVEDFGHDVDADGDIAMG
ncbi:hypothetical protein M406DRAFT_330341 [Cryphonectria parasitica EP155]|uniref:Uncharacterized protein n=1 Tax=Cryphonectria parasitica (strain ATCC 38755 / EP155) TaxID=660469 RepID=A0A9P5CPJ0_CRYP1|nr:uncharacterized protein M406DRAFT_330341 [Cryphonectria parasitica EP155]KAF3766534.1 hypothetical protein M406DRAFT_330341 [Cryphonectria parasitica EP155]